MALTATATKAVQLDIFRALHFGGSDDACMSTGTGTDNANTNANTSTKNSFISRSSVDRANLSLRVVDLKTGLSGGRYANLDFIIKSFQNEIKTASQRSQSQSTSASGYAHGWWSQSSNGSSRAQSSNGLNSQSQSFVGDGSTIIYARTTREVDEIGVYLQQRLDSLGLSAVRVATYHAKLSPGARETSHRDFLTGRSR